jgi:hypothetical protein
VLRGCFGPLGAAARNEHERESYGRTHGGKVGLEGGIGNRESGINGKLVAGRSCWSLVDKQLPREARASVPGLVDSRFPIPYSRLRPRVPAAHSSQTLNMRICCSRSVRFIKPSTSARVWRFHVTSMVANP